ncbi:hypothetical protein ERJ75_001227700 [Trypanosoma vivax]|uniref:Uncharacterized protein n=1 Tax=Trypanosoma vivax (strain Y486) TaxID=1055687 RepID=G0U1C6_TRYVY|nr:hypothetical protein ERJ75_001227700 [Trypanosoma vivax]CCC49881.1 conserved hypothetical protein [Trypanosoma vivax Y486]
MPLTLEALNHLKVANDVHAVTPTKLKGTSSPVLEEAASAVVAVCENPVAETKAANSGNGTPLTANVEVKGDVVTGDNSEDYPLFSLPIDYGSRNDDQSASRGKTGGDGASLKRCTFSPRTTSASRQKRVQSPKPLPCSRHPGRRAGTGRAAQRQWWMCGSGFDTVGVGTTGLYETKRRESTPPSGAVAVVNGQTIVAPRSRVLRMREFEKWRDHHRNFLANFRLQDPHERVCMHRRRQKRKQNEAQQEQEAYAAAVGRMRQFGKVTYSDPPRPVNMERQQWLQEQRNALLAGREEVFNNNLQKGSVVRKKSAAQLKVVNSIKQNEKLEMIKAVQQERGRQEMRREALSQTLRRRVQEAKAIRESWREYGEGCRSEERSHRRQYVAMLRNRVRAVSPSSQSPPPFGGTTLSATLSTTQKSPQTRTHSGNSWRNSSHWTPRLLPNCNDETYRRQWLAELQEQRLQSVRASAENIRSGRSNAMRRECYIENCNRAELLRMEKQKLSERKRHLKLEVISARYAMKETEVGEKKMREEAQVQAQERKRREVAAFREAIQQEKQQQHEHEEEEMRRLREKATQMRNAYIRRIQANSPKRCTPMKERRAMEGAEDE